MEMAGADLYKKDEKANDIANLLGLVQSDMIRDAAMKQIQKDHGIKIKDLKTKIKEVQSRETQKGAFKTVKVGGEDGDALAKVPASVDRNEVLRWGFYGLVEGEKTGYYFRTSSEGNFRSEERRVGKEWGAGGWRSQ